MESYQPFQATLSFLSVMSKFLKIIPALLFVLFPVLVPLNASAAEYGISDEPVFSDTLEVADSAEAEMIASANVSSAVEHDPDYLNSIKITFLSWFSGSTKVSYERAFPSVKQSAELCVSMIGAGYDKYDNNPLGFTVRYGHKFFLADNEKCSLRGFYLRPEVAYSWYEYDRSSDGARTLADMCAIMGTVGYQYVYKRLLVDAWVGGGYAFGTPAETYYHHGFELWHWFGTVNTNIALSFSIRVGVCF